jgi:hypothetical protein
MNTAARIQWLKTCTARQREAYYDATVKAGCAACKSPYRETGTNRTALHHCVGHGFPAKREHRPVIGLCAFTCHQFGPEAFHSGRKSFEAKHGTQLELLTEVERRMKGN